MLSGRIVAERWVKAPDRYQPMKVERDGDGAVVSFNSSEEYVVGWLYRVRLEDVLKGEAPHPKGTVQVFLRRAKHLHDFGSSSPPLRGDRTYLFFLVAPNADLPSHLVEPMDLGGATVGGPGPPEKGENPPRVDSIYRPVRYPKAIAPLRGTPGELDAVRACWDESYRAPEVAWLVAPEGPGTPPGPVFEWRVVERAVSYELTVLGPGLKETAFELIVEPGACGGTSCAAASPKALAPGAYRWTVEAKNRFGGSGKVVPLEFRVGPD